MKIDFFITFYTSYKTMSVSINEIEYNKEIKKEKN